MTDPNGGLANAFASVQGKDAETFLAPVDAPDPMAGFLGAMLGEDQGSALLPWLAGHLGDAYAETTIGGIGSPPTRHPPTTIPVSTSRWRTTRISMPPASRLREIDGPAMP
ncbi:MAG TPA: hypothetical protein VGQ89_15145 [Candidatus Limnocylindrales bacterium]|nr:hypothetical protein [Candidatus Limnocylindrales bacterium]